jgi:alpha-1,6-mannosyltransferase
VLTASGVGLVGACVALARIDNLVEAPRAFLALFGVAFACYAGGVWGLRARRPDRRGLLVVLAVAGLCRLALFAAPPTLSTDAYRYVWDARVANAGVSPYAAAPTAPELTHVRDATIYPRLNHPTWRTVYPPGAQLVFRAVYALAPDSVVAMKAAMALGELATFALLASLLRALGRPLTHLAVYAWNPLVLVETWGSAHLDALAMLCVVAALRLAIARRATLAVVVLAVGTLVKLYPAALLPLLLGGAIVRSLALFALVVIVGYAPFAHLGTGVFGSLSQYVSSEFFNPGLVRTLVEGPALSVAALGAWVAFAARRRRDAPLPERAITMIGGLVILSPNVFPWYALWLVPFLAIQPSVPWIAFTGTVAFAYTFFLNQPWTIPAWARAVEVLPLALGALWAVGRKWSSSRLAMEEGLAARPGGQP